MKAMEELQREVSMMTSPWRWPRWPILCMKRSPMEESNFGCLAEIDGEVAPTIYPLVPGGFFKYDFGKPMKFMDFEAIYDAGWRVD